MDESGIDMGFDLAALTRGMDEDGLAGGLDIEYSNDLEQALSLLPSSQDFMYYELKSRAPDTGRCVLSSHTHNSERVLHTCALSLPPYSRSHLLRAPPRRAVIDARARAVYVFDRRHATARV